ncbi:unnamed protein product, partial [Onchocerca ochengi]
LKSSATPLISHHDNAQLHRCVLAICLLEDLSQTLYDEFVALSSLFPISTAYDEGQ